METGKSDGLNDRHELPDKVTDELWGEVWTNEDDLETESLIDVFEYLFPDAMQSARDELGEPIRPRRRRNDSGT